MGLQEMSPQEASRAWGSRNPARPGHPRPSVAQVLWACGGQMEGERGSQGDPGRASSLWTLRAPRMGCSLLRAASVSSPVKRG